MQRRSILILSILLLLLLSHPGGLLAQGQQAGTLTGTVKDTNGDATPGVTVTVSSASLLGERTAFTGTSGDYVLKGLPPGQYKVLYELSGMATVERTVTIELGRTSRSDAEMKIAQVEDVIVVTGETPNALETSTIGANYDAETIDSLATARTLFGITQLAPGLTTKTPNAGQVTIAGAFAYDNVFLIDGVDTNDNLFGTSNNLFIEDAIEETQVLTNGISAEYGRFTGGVINAITKSGGNQFSGSFRADLTNADWRDETGVEDANGITRQDDINEVFQATLGGYVLRDKLWFFLAGRDQSTSTQNVFNFTNVAFNNAVDNERLEIKLTGNVNASHTVQAQYTDNESTQTSPNFGFTIDPRSIRTRQLPNELQVARYNGVLSSNLFAELQYSEKQFGFRNSGGTSRDIRDSPFLGFSQGLVHYNQPYFDSTDPEDRNNEQLAASASYFLSGQAAGSHDLKVGFEDFTTTNTGGNSQSATDYVFEAEFLADANGNAVLDSQGRLQPVFDGGVVLENWVAQRGARIEIQTQSLFINDRWNLNDHWSFNLGARYEDVGGDASDGQRPVASDAIVPRLAASYDIHGDGKYKVDVTYAEYAGKYSEAQFSRTTNVGNPDVIYSFYTGPSGVGLDFAPGFDLANYTPFFAIFPTQSVFFEDGLSSPRAEEFTVSFGLELGRGGYLKATFTDRTFSDFVEDFFNEPNNPVVVSTPAGPQVVDRQVFRNSSIPSRDYQAIQVQGRYRLSNNWFVEGHWTHQLDNDGNFEGEATNQPGNASPFGDYPEIFNAARHYPDGRLNDFQEDRVRLWTTYNWDLGKAGNVATSLLYSYDTGGTFSFSSAQFPITATQAALDPGYASPPVNQTIFFGERGAGQFEDSHTFDLAVNYSIPLWKSLEPWVKVEVRNLLNDDSLVGFNTGIVPNTAGPTDELGLPTTFTLGPNFGNGTTNAHFNTPREYLLSGGIRF
jgi:hypothetical protein